VSPAAATLTVRDVPTSYQVASILALKPGSRANVPAANELDGLEGPIKPSNHIALLQAWNRYQHLVDDAVIAFLSDSSSGFFSNGRPMIHERPWRL